MLILIELISLINSLWGNFNCFKLAHLMFQLSVAVHQLTIDLRDWLLRITEINSLACSIYSLVYLFSNLYYLTQTCLCMINNIFFVLSYMSVLFFYYRYAHQGKPLHAPRANLALPCCGPPFPPPSFNSIPYSQKNKELPHKVCCDFS